MFCDTDISSLCNLHCSKKINMEVVIKAMDILNQFGWHHFISDCISHFFLSASSIYDNVYLHMTFS